MPAHAPGNTGRDQAEAGYPDLPDGARLGRFRVGRLLDRSGTRCVYAAKDAGTGEAVTIKIGRRRSSDGRRESDEEVLARLCREADVLRQLDDAAVPRVKDLNERPPYLVLERIDAVDLDRLLTTQARDFTAPDIAALAARLAEALTAIHLRGFLHGDIKPSNILIRPDGSPLLIDFGSARRFAALDDGNFDDWSLTPEYAPPEFDRADIAIGPWSDIYSLGAVAYRLVTGGPPVSAQLRWRGAPTPSAIEAAKLPCPLALCAAIDWALELDPAARPFSAEEWRHAMRDAAQVRPDADPPTLRIRRRMRPESDALERPKDATRPGRRWPRRASGVAAGLAALALAALALPAGRELYALYADQAKQEWTVDAGGRGDTTTIAAALARARDGAAIHVRPGLYQESLVIARPVELLGIAENGQQAVIAPASGACIKVAATARLANLVLRGANGEDSKDAPCVDVTAGRIAIEGTRISGASGAGVVARNGAELHVVGSAVTGSGGAGVLVASGAKAALSGGEIAESGRSGVIARGGSEIRIAGTHVGGAREAGLLLVEGAVARVENATISESGASGIEISGGARGTIVDSVIARATQAGLFVSDAAKATVERTQFTANGFSGLIVADGGEASVDSSVFEDNREHGVLVLDQASGAVVNSRIIGNAGHGIAVQRSAAGEMTGNVVERNREPQVFDARRSDAPTPDRRRGGAS